MTFKQRVAAAMALLAAGWATGAGAEPRVEPDAVAAVERMGDYLATLKTFSVRGETATDEVLLTGPKVQFQGTLDLVVRWPDRLRATTTRDGMSENDYFYDGTSLSVWIKDRNAWASIPAPGTIPELIALLKERYELSLPIEDLLLYGSRKQLLGNVTAGIVVGDSLPRGVPCDHLAFHQEDLDWQLWIEQGDRPLPRKMLITTLDEPSQPQYSAFLTWDLAPKVDEATFTFVPPPGAERIVIAEVPKTKAPSKGGKAAKPASKPAKQEASR